MRVRLKILRGQSAGKELKVPAPECLIGRESDCHVRPKSDAISRRHCVIVTSDNEVVVRDLHSRNGTFVNGERVTTESVLLTGDILRVGPLEFEMQIEHTSTKKAGSPTANETSTPEGTTPEKEIPATDTKPLSADAGAPDAKMPGKLPPRPAAQTGTSREAASQTLKRFFNGR